MEFIIEDFKSRNYKVDCVEDKDGLWCMVYCSIAEDEYEEDYSADFCVHTEDCDLNDEEEILDFIQDCFYDKDWFYENLYSAETLGDDEDDYSETPSAGIKYFEDRGKKLLKEYDKWSKDKGSMNCGIDLLEEMRDLICDFVYSE